MADINQKSMVTLMDEEPFKAVEGSKYLVVFISLTFNMKMSNSVCGELDSMIDNGTPPDLVLDLSMGGPTSDVVKSLSLTLGLPTVSSTMGEAEDIREWESLTAEQEKYLIQVRSPSDMFQYIIKDMAVLTNITNCAILFDESFGL